METDAQSSAASATSEMANRIRIGRSTEYQSIGNRRAICHIDDDCGSALLHCVKFPASNAGYWVESTRRLGPLRKHQKNPRKPGAFAALPAMRSRLYESRRKVATLGAGVLAVGMGYGVVFGHNGLTAFAHKRQEAHELQIQMQQLQQENGRLREHVGQLQNDPAAIEHQAREELHYTRAGEVIYTLPASPQSTPQPSGSH
jgi:cell division protein FtsB